MFTIAILHKQECCRVVVLSSRKVVIFSRAAERTELVLARSLSRNLIRVFTACCCSHPKCES